MSKIVIITLIIAILIICSPFIFDFFHQLYFYTFELGWFRGEKTKEEVVAKYVEGLRTGNNQILEKLVSKIHEETGAIQEKIEKFKGADFSKAEIYYDEPPFPLQVEIKNIRLKNGEIASDVIWVEEDCHRYPGIIKCRKWYLVIGRLSEKPELIFPTIEFKND